MAKVTVKSAPTIALALDEWNTDTRSGWTLGTNWTNVGTEFETFINKYLFPKINKTELINVDLGNKYQFIANQVDLIAQYKEEYVIADAVPVEMNLSKAETLMLERNYPQMITKLYGAGTKKKFKFTLNDNDNRLNWLTLEDGITYAMAVLRKRLSDASRAEEQECTAMLVSYAMNNLQTTAKFAVTSLDDLASSIFEKLLNIQNSSEKYNEASTASGGAIGRYTTRTKLNDVCILTTDKVKAFLLDTKFANTYNAQGLDFSKRIISFDDLGGVWQATADITISSADTIAKFRAMGDYQTQIGDVFATGGIFTFDVSGLTEFTGNVEEVKPDGDLWAFVFDINAVKYNISTKNMISRPFTNEEFEETTWWLRYYSQKFISPFYNKVLLTNGTI